MEFVTVLTDINHSGFNRYLLASAKKNNIELTVLEFDDDFFSNRLKDLLLLQFLQDVSDDKLIFFSDASDAAFLSNEKEILEKMFAFEKELVFSAEVNCWPDQSMTVGYPSKPAHFRYLNCGAFIARAGFLKKIYEKYPVFETATGRYNWSNQIYWHHIFKHEQDSIAIDQQCAIFYNTSFHIQDMRVFMDNLRDPDEVETMYADEKKRLFAEIDIIQNRISVKRSGSLPCHIHFPGPISKLLMERGDYDFLVT